MANEVFISYSRKDLERVRKIKSEIDHAVGIDCWMDLDGIESGDEFLRVIVGAIKRSDTILFMLSSNSVGSEWAMDELDFARKEGKRIVLVDLEHTKMPDDIWFRYHRYDTIDWQSQPQRNKLLRDLRSWFGKSQPKPQPATKPQPQPRIEPKPQPQAVQTTNYTQLRQSQTRPVTKPNQPATNKKQIVWGIAGAALIALLIVLLTRSSHSSSSIIEESDYAASVGLCPDGNHPHIIDLGLPSGTKWACCNVGASKPEEYGDYFAWGETRQKATTTGARTAGAMAATLR